MRDVLAGALLLNAIPHMIMGLAGKRCMTPLGGANSTSAANIVWAGLNILGGAAALGPGTWRSISQRDADERLRAITWGIIAMAAFAAIYELTPSSARHRLVRTELASSPAPATRRANPRPFTRRPANPAMTALGVTGGVMLAVALGSGVAVPVFRSEAMPACLPACRRRSRWHHPG